MQLHYIVGSMEPTIVNEPKTGTLQLRINPEYKAQVETLFLECGMTLTEAINIFLQMSLKVGGLPFAVNRNPSMVVDDRAFAYLDSEYRKGLASSEKDGSWMSEEDVRSRYKRQR